MHLIHYNSHYRNKTKALCHGDGLAIIAVLFCVSKTNFDIKLIETVLFSFLTVA